MKPIQTLLLTTALLLTTLTASPTLAADAPKSFTDKITGHGPPVILIPGLSCSGEVWDGTVAHLKDHYQCHALTLAGFGGPPRIPAPFLETVRRDLAAYIREQKLDHPVIIGHSLGGFLALSLASHDPDLPGKLVIVDAYPFLPATFMPDATPATAKPMAEQMRAGIAVSKDEFVANSKQYVKSMVTKPADLDRVMAWVKNTDPLTAGDATYEMFTTDLRGDLAHIKSPTLVLATWIAYKDYTTSEEVAARAHKQYAQLKNCQIVMSETRHFIMLDDPAWFYQNLDPFLTQK